MTGIIRFALALALPLLAAGPVLAQGADTPAPPPAETPRFSMQPVDGGLVKLDTRTGAMSFCSSRGGTSGQDGIWRCEVMPDERAALDAEIARLRDRLAARQGGPGVPDIAGPPRGPATPGTPPADKDSADKAPADTPPPSLDEPPGPNQEATDRIEEAMKAAETAIRRFFEMVERLRRDPPKGEPL